MVFSTKMKIREMYLDSKIYFENILASNLSHVLGVATNENYVYWSKVEGSEHEQPFVQINILYICSMSNCLHFQFPLFLCQQLSHYCLSIIYRFRDKLTVSDITALNTF